MILVGCDFHSHYQEVASSIRIPVIWCSEGLSMIMGSPSALAFSVTSGAYPSEDNGRSALA
jgi:hypothetical protein